MSRRYLTTSEAEAALKRGNSVECFIGGCGDKLRPGVRWVSISYSSEAFNVSIFETADLRCGLDLYEFGPLDRNLELDEPNETLVLASAAQCWEALDGRYPGSTSHLVNEGVVQDEYGDYCARGA